MSTTIQNEHKHPSRIYPQPSRYELMLVLTAVICCYCILYGPQVIINRWVIQYKMNPFQASSLVYATLIPMSIAPLSYGIFLGIRNTRTVILWGLGILASITALLVYAESYFSILICRLAQGFILPAILTSIMARLSATGPKHGPRLITYYLCGTVVGGLFGRLTTGYYVDRFGLETVWWWWAGLCALIAIAFIRLPSDQIPFNHHKITQNAVKRVVMVPSVFKVLLCGALMFGGFAAALNLLPIRAESLGITTEGIGGSSAVAHRYWGYLAGVVIALNAQRINRRLGENGRAPAFGLIIMAGALLWGTLSLAYFPLFLMVLGLCIGLFITHPLLAAYLTQLNPSERGLMSGLYVSSYYIGGALCSWLASLYMQSFGWEKTLSLLSLLLIFASGLIWSTLNKKETL